MTSWTRRPQEQAGTYRFDGPVYVTSAVMDVIPIGQICAIILHVKETALTHGGLEKVQIYDNYAGLTVYIIDQLEDIYKIVSPPEHNFSTLLFNWEY